MVPDKSPRIFGQVSTPHCSDKTPGKPVGASVTENLCIGTIPQGS